MTERTFYLIAIPVFLAAWAGLLALILVDPKSVRQERRSHDSSTHPEG